MAIMPANQKWSIGNLTLVDITGLPWWTLLGYPGGHYWVDLVDITGLPWWTLLSYPGGHYCVYHPGALSESIRKISMGAQSSNQLQRLDYMTGYQDSSCSNGHQVTCHIYMMTSSNGNIFRVTGPYSMVPILHNNFFPNYYQIALLL